MSLNWFPDGMLDEIEKTIEEDRLPPGLPLYNSVFRASKFMPLQRKREMEMMIEIAQSVNPRIVYEIGSGKGGGLYHWVKANPTVTRAIACEVQGTYYATLFEKAFPEVDFLWLSQSSYDPQTVGKVRQWLGADKIDCLFIDGDKLRFYADFEAYLPMMNPNGIVFFHDVNEPDSQMRKDFERARKGYRSMRLINNSEALEALRLEAAGLPPADGYEGWLRHWKGESCGVGVIWLGEKV